MSAKEISECTNGKQMKRVCAQVEERERERLHEWKRDGLIPTAVNYGKEGTQNNRNQYSSGNWPKVETKRLLSEIIFLHFR